METQTWTFLDKTAWGPGPWQDEPDKVQWPDAATGLPCLAVRKPLTGIWCGYVGLTPAHPLFGVGHSRCVRHCPTQTMSVSALLQTLGRAFDSDLTFETNTCDHATPESLLEVHGDLTFSGPCQADHAHGICHVPAPGEPADLWWLGFDCGHWCDVTPRLEAVMAPHLAHFPPLAEAEARVHEADARCPELRPVYRDLAYVQAQCAHLAAQLATLEVLDTSDPT